LRSVCGGGVIDRGLNLGLFGYRCLDPDGCLFVGRSTGALPRTSLLGRRSVRPPRPPSQRVDLLWRFGFCMDVVPTPLLGDVLVGWDGSF
jgi:hypothetical protein